MAGEKFCLNWKDFQSCASQAFNNLRKEKQFFDVTLVSEDHVAFESHRVVLSATSNFFKNILRKISNNHPVLYLHGIQSTSLQLILDYVYEGQVEIYQDQIDQFLTCASDLKVCGLLESGNNEHINEVNEDNVSNIMKNDSYLEGYKTNDVGSINNDKKVVSHEIVSTMEYDGSNDTSIQKLLEKISEMTDKVDGFYTCKVCSRKSRDRTNLGKHIESSHIGGITLTCNYCNKKCRSRESLRMHEIKFHSTK